MHLANNDFTIKASYSFIENYSGVSSFHLVHKLSWIDSCYTCKENGEITKEQ